MSNDIDINIGLNVDSASVTKSTQQIAQEVQRAGKVAIQHAMGGGAANNIGSSFAVMGGKLIQLATVGGIAAGAIAGTVMAVNRAEEAFVRIREAITGASHKLDQMILAEKQRIEILKIEADYIGRMRDIQLSMREAMFEAGRIADEIERRYKGISIENKNKLDQKNAAVEKTVAERKALDQSSINMLVAKAGQAGGTAILNNTLRQGEFQLQTAAGSVKRDVGLLGGIKESGVIDYRDQQGKDHKKRFHTLAQMKEILNNLAAESEMQMKEWGAKAKAKNKEKEQQQHEEIVTNESHEKNNQKIALMKRALTSEFQQQENSISGVDASGYAIRKRQMAEEHAAKLRHLAEYERLLLEAANRGAAEIETMDKDRLDRQLESELRVAAVRADSHQKTADFYNEFSSLTNRSTSGQESVKTLESNLKNILDIERGYQRAIESAKTPLEMRTAEMQRQTELSKEKLRYENESRLAAEKDKLTQMQQSATRSKTESAIEGSGNIAQTDIQAISDFRTKIFEGMRAGTMSAMDYEIAGIEKTYAMRKAREQEYHNQRMQDIKAQEEQREQQIKLYYQEATKASRDQVADLTRQLANTDLSSSARQQLERQLQTATGNIHTETDKMDQELAKLRTNARGSIAEETRFKVSLVASDARHKEQISYLSAIKTNTGQYVSAMSESYKSLNATMWSRTRQAQFGMNPALGMPDRSADIIAVLQAIAKNTGMLRNFNNLARYS